MGRPDHGQLEGRHGADVLAHPLDQLFRQLGVGPIHARLGDDEPDGDLALERVGHAHDGALGDIRVPGQHLLHGARREPVAGHVDDVVHAAHDVEIAVLVLVTRVARQVVAVPVR